MKTTELSVEGGTKETPFETAVRTVRDEALIHFGGLAAGAAIFDELGAFAEVKRIEMLARIRDEELWKQAGYKSWDECAKQIEGGRRQANRKIQELRECGRDFISVRSIVRINRTIFETLEVQDGVITTESGEKIHIDRDNAARIRDLVNNQRLQIEKRAEQLAEKERESKKYKQERDEQKRSAENARDRLAAIHRREEEAFADVDEDHRKMLLIQSKIDGQLMLLQALNNSPNLSPENQARLLALTEYLWREFQAVGDEVKDNYGHMGGALEYVPAPMREEYSPNAADQVDEYRKSREKKGKK